MDITSRTDVTAATANAAKPLTADQQAALKKLHDAATQFEGVFLNMLMSAMRDTVPKETIFGKTSGAEQMWQGMLDQQQADAIAKSGTLGVARIMENQLRSTVLNDAAQEAKTDTKRSSGS